MSSEEHIERSLGGIEAKLDTLLEAMRDSKETQKNHDERLRQIENKQSWVAGMAVAVGGGASFAVNWLKDHIK